MNWYKRLFVFADEDADLSPDHGQSPSYMSLDQIGEDNAFNVFQKSYEDATGQSWDKDKFRSRAGDWRFYGDENGYVAAREQRSGMLKLVGMAGNPRSILRGLQDLLAEGKPTWGMVSKDIADMAKRLGFKSPPGILAKMMIGKIPSYVFGNAEIKNVGMDGGVTFDYPDIGEATKYYVANDAYYQILLSDDRVPGWGRPILRKILGQ